MQGKAERKEVARGTRTTRPLAEELPELLAERGMSLRSLGRAVGVNQSYLSRILGAKQSRPASKEVAGAIAETLGLARDYFPEYRLAAVIEQVTAEPRTRDRVYDLLRAKR